jgi:Zinc dependent phospholipase C
MWPQPHPVCFRLHHRFVFCDLHMRLVTNHFVHTMALVLAVCLFCCPVWGYSVLTHEQVVDLMWKDQIQPLLLKRFAGASEDDLLKAHAYAYGGSLVQDMGYYPFGSMFFSDLVHYVRSGDFVNALLRDSADVNEYAFALGALSHYAADNSGHPTINLVVALEFPKLKKRYGNTVTYADDPKAHIRTEFGFDMVQVAKNRYTSDRYHDMIGFEVAKPLLQRAFQETYGLRLEDVFGSVDLAIGSYRRSVSKMIPEMTRVALLSRKDVIVKDTPNFNRKKFLYYLSRSNYEHEWGTVYRKPGVGARILAFFLKLIPKVGPFKAVNFKIPTKQTEDMYINSVNTTVENYSVLLHQVNSNNLDLLNRDFDTGRETRPGEYGLTDKTYAELIDKLASKNSDPLEPALRDNLLNFYSDPDAPVATRKDAKAWQKLQDELEKLKQRATSPTDEKSPVLNQ